MHYMTIILEHLYDPYPTLHERLQAIRPLLSTVSDTAACLKRRHESRTDRLTQARPDSDPAQIASQAHRTSRVRDTRVSDGPAELATSVNSCDTSRKVAAPSHEKFEWRKESGRNRPFEPGNGLRPGGFRGAEPKSEITDRALSVIKLT
jgi:hypothetical protein